MRAMLFVVTFVLFVGELDARKRRGKPTPVTKKQSLRQRLTRPNLSEAELRQKLALELIDARKERDALKTEVNSLKKELSIAEKELQKIPAKEALIARLERDNAGFVRKTRWMFAVVPLTALFTWFFSRRKYCRGPKAMVAEEALSSLPEQATNAS